MSDPCDFDTTTRIDCGGGSDLDQSVRATSVGLDLVGGWDPNPNRILVDQRRRFLDVERLWPGFWRCWWADECGGVSSRR